MAKQRFLVCGGCGFIGSNFTRALLASHPKAEITVFDRLTYAGSLDNLGELHRDRKVQFVKGDIAEPAELKPVFVESFDLVINFAAETHVDRSLYYPAEFVRANILGTEILLTLCREHQSPFLQISTDEVYGAASENDCFTETAPYNPTSPYAASKASADLLVLAAVKTFKQAAAIVRTTNNYGPRQFPEKLIPFFIHLLRNGQPLPVYGDGLQLRSWLHVEDFCGALLRLVEDFPAGEVYNVGATKEYTNLEIVRQIIDCCGGQGAIHHVTDRPAHDRRYYIDSTRYESRFGTITQRDLKTGLKETIDWYQSHSEIFACLQSAENLAFRETHYGSR